MKSFLESSKFTKLILSLVALLIALIIFWLGTFVGYKQAEFSSRWEGNYAKVFGGPRMPFMSGRDSDDIVSTGGAVGQVMAVSLPTIAVKNANEAEKVVVLNNKTQIFRLHSPATTTDIHVGDFVMTVGTPDDQGRIVATFMRIMPPPPTGTSTLPLGAGAAGAGYGAGMMQGRMSQPNR